MRVRLTVITIASMVMFGFTSFGWAQVATPSATAVPQATPPSIGADQSQKAPQPKGKGQGQQPSLCFKQGAFIGADESELCGEGSTLADSDTNSKFCGGHDTDITTHFTCLTTPTTTPTSTPSATTAATPSATAVGASTSPCFAAAEPTAITVINKQVDETSAKAGTMAFCCPIALCQNTTPQASPTASQTTGPSAVPVPVTSPQQHPTANSSLVQCKLEAGFASTVPVTTPGHFLVDPSVIIAGSKNILLTWGTTNAISASLSTDTHGVRQDGTNQILSSLNGSEVVQVAVTTTFTLYATGKDGTTCSDSVNVSGGSQQPPKKK